MWQAERTSEWEPEAKTSGFHASARAGDRDSWKLDHPDECWTKSQRVEWWGKGEPSPFDNIRDGVLQVYIGTMIL